MVASNLKCVHTGRRQLSQLLIALVMFPEITSVTDQVSFVPNDVFYATPVTLMVYLHWEFEQIRYTVNQLKITKVEYNLWTGLCHDFNFEGPSNIKEIEIGMNSTDCYRYQDGDCVRIVLNSDSTPVYYVLHQPVFVIELYIEAKSWYGSASISALEFSLFVDHTAPMDYPVPRSYFAVVNGLVDTSYSVPDLFSPELECNVHIDTCQLSITWLNGVNNYNTTEVNFQCLSTTWIGMAVAFDLTAKKLYIFSSSEGLWNEITISDEVVEDVGAGNITFNNRIVMKCVQYFDNVFLTNFDLQKISLRCFGKTKILKYKI
ncbi:hypothetical protein EB796_023092 [Bugula neritina]|uniref:Uncharacterized protein n=1 Tax=Bugula neritina TaxID=10212 RepID=A0A7J7IXF2_BUGNE|nr:hypothetical protein EB796_023092 [Bugula neritina]